MTLIRSIMHKKVVSVPRDATVQDAVKAMSKHKIGAVLIAEGKKAEGIFSERDLLVRVIAKKKNPETTPVKEVCTAQLTIISEHIHVKACIGLIKESGFRHLPVVNADGDTVGIISSRDLLQYVLEEAIRLSEKETFLQNMLAGDDFFDYFDERVADGNDY